MAKTVVSNYNGDPALIDNSVSASMVRRRYEAGIKGMRPDLNEYWMNHAFLLGHQWLFWNTVTQRLDEMPRDPDRVQMTVNRMFSNTRSITSKLLQRELQFDVLPSESDDATIRGARLAESAIHEVHLNHDWEAKRESSALVCLKGGTSAICVDWDPELGNHIVTTSDDKQVYQGDTVETVLSIAEMVVEPGSMDAERARWWVKARALPPGEVKALYKLKDLPASDISSGMSPFLTKLLVTSMNQNGSSDLVDLTLVLTYYERPNSDRPKGLVCVVVGDKLVDGPKPWPFPFTDHLNFAIAKETVVENKWLGSTVLSQARSIQAALNASWSSVVEHMKLAGNARLYVAQSSIDLMEQLTDLPGEMVPFPDGVQMPQWGAPPAMPGWWIQMPEVLAKELDDVMGVHDVSRGQAPVNVQSGYGLSVLAEQDAGPVTRLSKELAHQWGKVASMVLEIYVEEVKDTRTSVIHTPTGVETAKWNGKDLEGQTTAVVPLDAVLPRSRAGMQAMAEKMLQMGAISTGAQFAKIAELPDQHSLIDTIDPQVAKARRENAMMAQSKACIPIPIDNHAVHIQEHINDMLSLRFDLSSEEDKQIRYDHLQAHETMAAEEAVRQVAKAAIDPTLGAIPDRAGAPPAAVNEAMQGLQDASAFNFDKTAAKATLPNGNLGMHG